MIYTLDDLEENFGEDWVSNGSFVLDEHPVAPNVQRGGELVTAMINTGRQRIRVYIKIRSAADGAVRVEGECTCPSGRNCRHVSAVLIKALSNEQELPDIGSESLHALDQLASNQATLNGGSRLDYPPDVRQRLIYVLSPDRNDMRAVRVETHCVRVTDGGAYADARPYEPAWAQRGTPPRFLLGVDLELLGELVQHVETPLRLSGVNGERTLRAMLATARCHWGDVNGPCLRLAEPLKAAPFWALDDHGDQRWCWAESPVFLLDALWHVDDRSGRCAPLATDVPNALITELASLGAVMPQQVSQVADDLQQRYPGIALPRLRRIAVEDYPAMRPRPHLHLCDREDGPVAKLSFEYRDVRVGVGSPATVFKDGKLIRLARDESAERDAFERLVQSGLTRQENGASEATRDCLTCANEPLPWLSLQDRAFTELMAQGWCCSVAADFPYRLAQPEHWYGELEAIQRGEYGVSLGVRLAGRNVNLLPVLVDWLDKQPSERVDIESLDERGLPLHLDDGRYLLLSRNRLEQILDALFELFDDDLDEAQRLRLNRFQVARLAELGHHTADEPLQWLGAEELKTLANTLRNIDAIPTVAVPAGLGTVLRRYQQQGLDWLQFLREHRLAGILADDMGLGKTVQALAHLLYEKEHGRLTSPALVVAPTSLMNNWRQAARQFAPDLGVCVLHGPRRHTLFDDLPRQDLVITSYPLLLRDRERLAAQEFYLLILDEAQVVKNSKAKASGVIRELNATHRLCLTGTPLENHLGELWSLFDFLLPGLLGSERQFRLRCRKPIEKWGDEHQAERLRRRIRPFLLRRTKQAVAPELPPKTEITHSVDLATEQQALYEDIRLSMYQRVRAEVDDKGIARCGIVILSALLKLRQVCCDPRLLSPAEREHVTDSAKLAWLLDFLPEMIEEGRRVLLFSQFTSMLALIEQALRRTGIDYVKLTGRTRDRSTPIERFQRGDVPLFLISLKAGGVGLNLTAADTVIHYDPWWNPAAERQATDRAHRIGQENPVFVYKLISAGTVEERIQALQERKQALADSLYDSSGGANPRWTEEDVEELFKPLS